MAHNLIIASGHVDLMKSYDRKMCLQNLPGCVFAQLMKPQKQQQGHTQQGHSMIYEIETPHTCIYISKYNIYKIYEYIYRCLCL